MGNYNEIIKKCLNKNSKAESDLFEMSICVMRNACIRYNIPPSDEYSLFNLIFDRILSKLHIFDLNKNYEAWLYKISCNIIIDYFRSYKKYSTNVELVEVFDTCSIYSYNEGLNKLLNDDIKILLTGSTDLNKKVFYLFNQGYTHSEISNTLSISEECSRWHLFRTRKIIQQNLLVM